MANASPRFKDRDVKGVIKAARAAGLDVARIEVNARTGQITVVARQSDEPVAGNDLDNWLATRKKDANPA